MNPTHKPNPLLVISFGLPLLGLIVYWAGKPLPRVYETGYSVPLNALYSLFLVSLVLLVGGGLGNYLLKFFKIEGWTNAEKILISLPIGLAGMAYLVFGLGLLGVLSPLAFSLLIALLGGWRWRDCLAILSAIPEVLRSLFEYWKGLRIELKILCVIGTAILLLTLLLTLTPPFDYDSLAYHLQGPRLFLEAGRIQPIYENWFTFYPFTWEMLYMLGLGLGSDIFAKLIHYSTMLLFLLSGYVFGRRLVSPKVGWISVAVLLGIPILLLWGSTAYTDIAWALFQFLAVGLILLWMKEGENGYLVLAGVMQGLAMGSKYPALASGAAIGVVVLWLSWRQKGDIPAWKRILQAAWMFGGTALLVASPWYVKNLIQTGDPVYPLLLPPRGIDPLRVKLWLEYVYSFGVGKEWYHYLLLPIHLYTEYKRFGTFIGAVDIPSPVFLLVFLYAWPRSGLFEKDRKVMDLLVTLIFIQFVIWAAGSQQTRFLMAIYPPLSICAAMVLLAVKTRYEKLKAGYYASLALVSSMILLTGFIISGSVLEVKPYLGLVNQETREEFLTKMLNDYPGLQYISKQLPEGSKVMMLWDGRGYYCDRKCLADVDQVGWTTIAKEKTVDELITFLVYSEITHLFNVINDRDYFLLGHDPYKTHKIANEAIEDLIKLNCLSNTYIKNEFSIYQNSSSSLRCKQRSK